MKLYRYMGLKEFEMLTAGIELISDNSHYGYNTSSVGFCFLPEVTHFEVEGEEFNYNPVQCYAFLHGPVRDDVLIEFEADEKNVVKGYGIYADPTFLSGWDGKISITEYSTTRYSRDTFVPVRYAILNNDSADWFACN